MFWGDSPVLGTGFGNVIKFLAANLPKEEFKISVLGMYHKNKKHDLPYIIYSTTLHEEQRNPNKIKKIITKEKPDILFLLHDVWNMQSIIEFLKNNNLLKQQKVIGYTPVDAEDHNPNWYTNLNLLDQLVVYNNFGKSVVKKAAPHLDTVIIEHGVDNNIFYKLKASRKEIAEALFTNGSDLENAFVFLNAGRNQPRKVLDISMRAFAKFSENKDNVYLYMHCAIMDSYINIARLAEILGIQNKLLMTSYESERPNIPEEHLNAIYNFCDVGLNSGLGEGFGLPNAEHSAVGKPQIVPNHSALTDLYKDCGLLVPAKIPVALQTFTTTGYMISVDDMASKMELLYNDKDLYKDLSKKSEDKFTSEKYSWKHIGKQWSELFKTLIKN